MESAVGILTTTKLHYGNINKEENCFMNGKDVLNNVSFVLCPNAAQEGVLSCRANGPGDLHGQADPIFGQ